MFQKGKRKIKKKGRQAGKKEPFPSSFSFKSISGRIRWQPCQLLRVGSRLQWGNQISALQRYLNCGFTWKRRDSSPQGNLPTSYRALRSSWVLFLRPWQHFLLLPPTGIFRKKTLVHHLSFPATRTQRGAFTGVLSRLRVSQELKGDGGE